MIACFNKKKDLYLILLVLTSMAKKKKGFISRLLDRLDSNLEKKSKECCCCKDKKKKC